MATNLKEFFSAISEGVELGEGFDIESIPEVELPEAFNESFHKKYLTVLSAKNNKDIMGHFRGQYLSDADNRLKSSFLANGGTAEMFKELKDQEPDSMKLIDLVYSKGLDLNKSVGTGDNAEFEAYKIQTSKQIEELLNYKENAANTLNDTVNQNDINWAKKLKNTMITSKLNGRNFDGGMSKEDAIYLTMRKLEDSNFDLRLDENLQERVFKKDEPDFEATVDGKSVTWDYVLDTFSADYVKKNDQGGKPEPVVVNVSTNGVSDPNEGVNISGHPNYKGAQR